MILHLFSVYESFLNSVPNGLRSESELLKLGFGWSNFFSLAMNRLGVPAQTHLTNPSVNEAKKLFQKCLDLAPDILLAQGLGPLPLRWLKEIKHELRLKNRNFRLVGWSGAPFSELDLEKYKVCDLVLTCNPRTVGELRQKGVDSDLLHHGFPLEYITSNTLAHSPKDRTKRLIFAGSLLQGDGFHEGRIRFLEMMKAECIPVGIYSAKPNLYKLFLKKALGRAASTISKVPLVPSKMTSKFLPWKSIEPLSKPLRELSRYFQKPKYGFELLDLLSANEACLNFHIDHSGDFAGNHRLFEATGTGACLITDHKKNLSELFEVDQEIVSYSSVEECAEKVRYLFNHPAEMRMIAERGKRRCLKEHTFDHRAQEFLDLLKKRGWFSHL